MSKQEYHPVKIDYKDSPENKDMKSDVIYIVSLPDEGQGIRFLCPCGCKLPIWIPLGEMNNEGGSGPRELIWHDEKTISISPSIQVKGGCNYHFFIQKNKVIV
jgi:hypothetical protein